MVKCINCNKEAMPIKKFNTLLFILLIPLLPFALLYAIIFAGKSPKICPYCKQNIYEKTVNTWLKEKWYRHKTFRIIVYIFLGMATFDILINLEKIINIIKNI